MTNNLNTYNKENVEFQANLQKDIQNAQLADAYDAKQLQDYSAQVGRYQGEVQANVQIQQANIAKLTIDYQWMQGQLAYLKQYYNELFGMQQVPQGGER